MTAIKSFARAALVITLVAAGAFWIKQSNDADIKRAAETHQKRAAIAQSAEPSAKTFKMIGGELTILTIPYTMEIDPTFIEMQRCFVWRDFGGSATMACPSRPEIVLSK